MSFNGWGGWVFLSFLVLLVIEYKFFDFGDFDFGEDDFVIWKEYVEY